MTLFIQKPFSPRHLGSHLPLSGTGTPLLTSACEILDANRLAGSRKSRRKLYPFGEPDTSEEQVELQTLRAEGYIELRRSRCELIEKKAKTKSRRDQGKAQPATEMPKVLTR